MTTRNRAGAAACAVALLCLSGCFYNDIHLDTGGDTQPAETSSGGEESTDGQTSTTSAGLTAEPQDGTGDSGGTSMVATDTLGSSADGQTESSDTGLEPACDGDIEIDTNWGEHIGTEVCVCKPSDGGPYEPVDPALCGCVTTVNGCECDGITFAGDTCGCVPVGAECLCDGVPSDLTACGPCGMVGNQCICGGTAEDPTSGTEADPVFCAVACDQMPVQVGDVCMCPSTGEIADTWCYCYDNDGTCDCNGFEAPAYFCEGLGAD